MHLLQGLIRIGEDGGAYLISKSEHYHASVGHSFPGYRLIENARKLGITNIAHNNTRGHITRRLEEELGLKVNRKKSEVTLIKNVTFLAFQILRGKIRVSDKAGDKFKRKVRELTRRNNPYLMYQVIKELNKYLQGWIGYFRIQEFRCLFRDLGAWTRSRLRSVKLKKWKKPRKFQRIMIKAGFDPHKAHRTWVKMNKWQSVTRREVRFVLNNEWFSKLGLISMHNFTLATLKSH